MKCPICKDVTLVMSERQRVEIDFCPECRGVWLDRGELDKIIELSMQTTTEEPRRETRGSQDNDRHRGDERHHDNHRYNDKERDYDRHDDKRYRKRSFLMDLFD